MRTLVVIAVLALLAAVASAADPPKPAPGASPTTAKPDASPVTPQQPSTAPTVGSTATAAAGSKPPQNAQKPVANANAAVASVLPSNAPKKADVPKATAAKSSVAGAVASAGAASAPAAAVQKQRSGPADAAAAKGTSSNKASPGGKTVKQADDVDGTGTVADGQPLPSGSDGGDGDPTDQTTPADDPNASSDGAGSGDGLDGGNVDVDGDGLNVKQRNSTKKHHHPKGSKGAGQTSERSNDGSQDTRVKKGSKNQAPDDGGDSGAQQEPPKKLITDDSYVIAAAFGPQRNFVLADAARMKSDNNAYTYTFWYRPKQLWGDWSNIFHKGTTDGERNLAVWMIPNSWSLHVRSGTSNNWNDGLNVDGFSWNVWHHVTVTHQQGEMVVYINANQVQRAVIPAPLKNNGPLYGSNPWYYPAGCDIADFRFYDKVLPLEDIQAIFNAKKNIPTDVLRLGPWRIYPGVQCASAGDVATTTAEFTYMYNVRVVAGVYGGWGNVIHHGNSDYERGPAHWTYPGSFRMHLRSGIPANWNNGLDPEQQLPSDGTWLHLTVTHKQGELKSYFNGILQPGPGQMVGADVQAPRADINAPLWCSNPFGYGPANVELSMLRFYDRVLPESDIQTFARMAKVFQKQ